MKRTTDYSVKRRVTALFMLGGALILMLLVRLFWLQVIRSEDLSSRALENRMQDIRVEAKRGTIYDRNGHELAVSVSTESVYASPPEVRKSGRADEIARQLSAILGVDEVRIKNLITRPVALEWVKRQVDLKTAQELRQLDLPGIHMVEESRRYYPKTVLACHVLGISGIDNVGLEGIDLYYNNYLAGTPGRFVVEQDAAGRPIPDATHKYIRPITGNSLVLTIDETIQYIVERELDKVMASRQPKAAYAVVMDPQTGEILALANRPAFDPNRYKEFPGSVRRNYAVNNALEPGSTGKIITAAAALNEKVVKPNDDFYCPGFIKVGKHTIHEAQGRAHGSQTFTRVVENSCNVGFVQVGMRLGLPAYFKYVRAFGLGQKTGIDLPGEARGILVPEKRATQVDLATMSFGQANAVTAIQLLNAVCTVANGGVLYRPHLLKEVINDQGRPVKEIKPEKIRQVLSPKASQELCTILEGVVKNGTGQNAYVEGYRVAGKTGTAQKIAPGGGYMSDQHVASFIAFAPANEARLAALVVVDDPKGYPYYGGTVAAPLIKAILEDSLAYLGVPRQSENSRNEAPAEKITMPNLINLPLSEALDELRLLGLNAKVDGEGSLVREQNPQADTKVDPGSRVNLRMSPAPAERLHAYKVTVPDLSGKSMKEVARLLSQVGLILESDGYGIAEKQEPEAGTAIKSGSMVKVWFKPAY
ncbi:MAG: stage V sporulation protein D [Methylocystaceae bacterium]